MTSVLNILDKAVSDAFEAAGFPRECGRVNESDRPDLAPFQCNGAMMAAGFLKKQGEKANPREIAGGIAAVLSDHPAIAAVEIAGPGFLNLTPKTEIISDRANELAADPRTGAQTTDPQTIVIDYGGGQCRQAHACRAFAFGRDRRSAQAAFAVSRP